MKKEPQYVTATLAWCNRMRATRGDKPLKRLPKGTPKDGESCPCGTAANVFVSSDWWSELGNFGPEHPTPRCVQRFVAAFDSGKLPQYELPQYKN
jgi:hypothetical protein